MSKYSYPYPMAANTVTAIIETEDGMAILGKRSDDSDAYPGMLCLIGGFLDVNSETLEEAMVREIKEEIGLDIQPNEIKQILTTSTVNGPDPRYSQIINTIFKITVSRNAVSKVVPGDDIQEVVLFDIDRMDTLPKMAFDHYSIFKNLAR